MAHLRIGDLARLGGVSVRMLRHYHEIGLLEPLDVDRATGYRLYEADQIEALRRIVALKELGLTLDVVGQIVNGQRTPEQVHALLIGRRDEIVGEIATARSRLHAIDRYLVELTTAGGSDAAAQAATPTDAAMATPTDTHTDTTTGTPTDKTFGRTMEGAMMEGATMLEVETKPVEARLVAQLTAVAESWAPGDIGPVIQPLYPELVARMEQAGVGVAGPSTAWYDDTTEGRILVHATLGIAERPDAHPGDLGFDVVELPAIPLVASTVHRGTMDDCDVTYEALLAWIDANGYRPVGYSREIDIECGPDRQWITELQIQIEEREAAG